jgi:hypothetical protein
MDRKNIEDWFMDIMFCLVLGLVIIALVMAVKLAFDLWTAPNIFINKQDVVSPVGNTDEVCVKWLFQSNLDGAKKRICGR